MVQQPLVYIVMVQVTVKKIVVVVIVCPTRVISENSTHRSYALLVSILNFAQARPWIRGSDARTLRAAEAPPRTKTLPCVTATQLAAGLTVMKGNTICILLLVVSHDGKIGIMN